MSDEPEATEREQEEASEGRLQEQESMAAHGLEATPGRKTGSPSAPLGHEDQEGADEDGEQ